MAAPFSRPALVPCLLGLLLLSCNDRGTTLTAPGLPGPEPAPLNAAAQAVVSAGNSFSFRLFASLNSEAAGKNIFISPLSISMALGMTLNGAGGSTRDAIEQTLGCGGLTQAEINQSYAALSTFLTGLDPDVRMEIANSIWYRPDLQVEETFKSVNRQHFAAEITGLDFSAPTAAGTINGWVNNATHGRITGIVSSPIPRDMMMFLINAVYFKGSWTYRFDSTATRDDLFTCADGLRLPCRMMSLGDTLAYAEQDGIQVLELPYGKAGFSMTILLPPAAAGIDAFVSGLTQARWTSLISQLRRQDVGVQMPKFTMELEYGKDLEGSLKALGMEIAFTPSADFTGIDRRGGLCISEVKHKTFIQVDEEGTEAAAVTSIGVGLTSSLGGGPVTVRLDRPFLFAIREIRSGSILFMGKLTNPG